MKIFEFSKALDQREHDLDNTDQWVLHSGVAIRSSIVSQCVPVSYWCHQNYLSIDPSIPITASHFLQTQTQSWMRSSGTRDSDLTTLVRATTYFEVCYNLVKRFLCKFSVVWQPSTIVQFEDWTISKCHIIWVSWLSVVSNVSYRNEILWFKTCYVRAGGLASHPL